jgi:hypothetical protein
MVRTGRIAMLRDRTITEDLEAEEDWQLQPGSTEA